MSRTRDEEAFLSRWSRRKRAGGAVGEAPEEGPQEALPDAGAEAPDRRAPERSDAEILEELGLPDPETIGPGDDVRGFMAKAVPERLRTRALRRLWLSNPVLANLDELLDYGDDFTDAATVVENLQTVYRVGRGMIPDPEPEAPAGPEAADGAGPQPGAEEGAEAEAPAAEAEAPAGEPVAALAGPEAEPRAPALPAPGPRRPRPMRFT